MEKSAYEARASECVKNRGFFVVSNENYASHAYHSVCKWTRAIWEWTAKAHEWNGIQKCV